MVRQEDIQSLTLTQHRGLRRENAAILEKQARDFEHLNRFQSVLLAMQDEMRQSFHAVCSDINNVKSDALTLEVQNASRPGEILNISRQLDEMAD